MRSSVDPIPNCLHLCQEFPGYLHRCILVVVLLLLQCCDNGIRIALQPHSPPLEGWNSRLLDSIVLHSIVMHRAMPDLVQRASGVEVTVVVLLCKVVRILSLSIYIYIICMPSVCVMRQARV